MILSLQGSESIILKKRTLKKNHFPKFNNLWPFIFLKASRVILAMAKAKVKTITETTPMQSTTWLQTSRENPAIVSCRVRVHPSIQLGKRFFKQPVLVWESKLTRLWWWRSSSRSPVNRLLSKWPASGRASTRPCIRRGWWKCWQCPRQW